MKTRRLQRNKKDWDSLIFNHSGIYLWRGHPVILTRRYEFFLIDAKPESNKDHTVARHLEDLYIRIEDLEEKIGPQHWTKMWMRETEKST